MEYLINDPPDEFDILEEDFLSINKTKKIPKLKRIKIFGKKFVENNKNKCFIVYKNKIYPLQEYLSVIDTENENSIQIILVEYEIITDKSPSKSDFLSTSKYTGSPIFLKFSNVNWILTSLFPPAVNE